MDVPMNCIEKVQFKVEWKQTGVMYPFGFSKVKPIYIHILIEENITVETYLEKRIHKAWECLDYIFSQDYKSGRMGASIRGNFIMTWGTVRESWNGAMERWAFAFVSLFTMTLLLVSEETWI